MPTSTCGTTSRRRWRCWSRGEVEAAERAYEWCRRTQRDDGSWPMKVVARRGRGRQRRDQHERLPGGRRLAPLAGPSRPGVRRAVLARRATRRWTSSWRMQLPFGGIAWAQEWHDGVPAAVNRDALLAGCSSIYQSLRAGVALAELMGEPQPDVGAGRRAARPRAARAPRPVPGQVTFSMDWYYPVLGGAVRGDAGRALIDDALGRLRGARAGHPLRRHQPVGDRR